MILLKNNTITMVRISDGTQWSFPTMSEEGGASWRLRHTEWQPTKEERYALAGILDSYHSLIFAPTKKKLNLVTKDLKEIILNDYYGSKEEKQ